MCPLALNSGRGGYKGIGDALVHLGCPQGSKRSPAPSQRGGSGHPKAPQVGLETLVWAADKNLCRPGAITGESPWICLPLDISSPIPQWIPDVQLDSCLFMLCL